ncbi:MAG: tripartite tricarboxylate transporter TctB family protein [Acidaminobacter sp.]|uniref:tripartite tricarboxylate transporter TctB family protein n=1 Tax=Acidaminobacter sp. TaxID=1872102 RepID=UPI0013832788|nr:tripartite tricarboxylate transporter TctB family protein [Acidaminobacter sp.]MZQ99694.1 tripartite tricarboxylate transporter TctB family protein [Acidaminobacter sp.]
MSEKRRDIIGSIIFIIFGIFLFAVSFTVKTIIENDVGPAFMPKIVAVAIVIVSVSKLIIALKNNSASYTTEKKSKDDKMGSLLTILNLGAYVVLFEPLGFIISSIVYLILQMIILSDKVNFKPVKFAIISVASTVAIYFLFVYAFNLMLPEGLLGII